MTQKTFAFFPEAAFGPALNSVGIAQAVERMGHKAVFLSDPGFVDVYKGYGFEAHPVNLSEPMPAEQMAKFDRAGFCAARSASSRAFVSGSSTRYWHSPTETASSPA